MSPRKTAARRRYKCRHAFCPNHYTDVIGGDTAFGKHKTGAVCVPCFYAEQMIEQGQTIEQVEERPELTEMFVGLLGKTGWTWQDMQDSYQRMRARQEPGR